jgi:hypothetical protein
LLLLLLIIRSRESLRGGTARRTSGIGHFS